ncbi:MAG TPA: GntR family transcriptional regulator [Steroidobacteraceae bacterium]|nr:GntR family transcriptional regulator [Steroidobacteraceae bacterium]
MGSLPAPRLFTLQPGSGVPIYLQLMQQVRRMVASGQLTPGTELPSVREVATEYTVNPTTISKAYGLLENEGLLQRNRGKPMTIAATRPAGSLPQRLKQVEPQVEALVLAARQLELKASELCQFIEKKMEKNRE